MNLKRYTLFSTALNVLLAGAVAVLVVRERAPRQGAQVVEKNAVKQVTREIKPAPFQWSAVESEDYPTYIKNLHSIGCPEQTIRDIVFADVNALYDRKLQDLHSGALKGDQLALAAEALKREQASLLETLFPPAPAGADSSGNAQAGSNPSVAVAPQPEPASVPLFFLEPDPSRPMDEIHQNAWDDLQERFVAAVGGENQNPADPEYHKRWVKAQRDMDEAFHAQFGDDAYNELLLKRNASANTQ